MTGQLTDAERTVLILLANGVREKDIAKQSGKAVSTVHLVRNNAYRRMGADCLAEALYAALRAGQIFDRELATADPRVLVTAAAAAHAEARLLRRQLIQAKKDASKYRCAWRGAVNRGRRLLKRIEDDQVDMLRSARAVVDECERRWGT